MLTLQTLVFRTMSRVNPFAKLEKKKPSAPAPAGRGHTQQAAQQSSGQRAREAAASSGPSSAVGRPTLALQQVDERKRTGLKLWEEMSVPNKEILENISKSKNELEPILADLVAFKAQPRQACDPGRCTK